MTSPVGLNPRMSGDEAMQHIVENRYLGIVTARAMIAEGVGRLMMRGYLQAAMAVCALTASADGDVGLEERCAIDAATRRDPLLQRFTSAQAVAVLDDQLFRLRQSPADTRAALLDAIERAGRRPERAVALMRLAWGVVAAGGRIRRTELIEFETLCDLLDVDCEIIHTSVLGI